MERRTGDMNMRYVCSFERFSSIRPIVSFPSETIALFKSSVSSKSCIIFELFY